MTIWVESGRYWLFAGDQYYPQGGMDDYVGRYSSPEEARENVPAHAEWWHVIDRQTTLKVAYGTKASS